MTLDDLLRTYQALAAKNRLAEMSIAALEADPADYDHPDAVYHHLQAFAPEQGWLCFQSVVAEFWRAADLPSPSGQNGVILSGECVNTAGESLHVRQNGRGGWRVTCYRPHAGEKYLYDTVTLIAHEPSAQQLHNPKRLRYHRYWKLEPNHGMRPFAACFIGFEGGA
jgi:hypothetical protein